jgi:hypothetical protein
VNRPMNVKTAVSCPHRRLLASQEGICFMKSVDYVVIYNKPVAPETSDRVRAEAGPRKLKIQCFNAETVRETESITKISS